MSKQHTPGPWSTCTNPICPSTGSECVTIYANDENATYVADVYRNYVGSERVTETELAANARLIAAAPELLEALESAQQILHRCHEEIRMSLNDIERAAATDVMASIRASLAKARGDA